MKFSVVAALLVAVTPLAAQQGPPKVGIVDVYGARTLTADQLRSVARIHVGDSITGPLAFAAKNRLLTLPNVAAAGVDVVCCENGQSIVYLGVRERSDSAMSFAPPPAGAARLPEAILAAHREFMKALQEAVKSGETEESDSLGHSMMEFAPARAVQVRYQQYAAGNIPLLRNVLHTSGDAQHRALAAQIIAYAPNKSAVVPDLVRAMRDPSETVRNNATRALSMMAMWAQRHPESNIKVPYEPFVDMLNSPIWTDRNKSAFALMSLSESKDPALMRALRIRAFASLSDMVRWQHMGHALPAAMILGRMGNMSEEDIMKAFETDRNALITAARARK
jgi:hypothetical protein